MAKQIKKVSKKVLERKWKGKDWFNISAPDWLGGSVINQTPATDSKLVSGRVIEVPISELTRDQSKYYMRVSLKADKLNENEITTKFHKFFCLNEYIMRLGRKGLGKVEIFQDVETKDAWKLQVSIIVILNRRAMTEIKKKVIGFASGLVKEKAKDLNHDEFVKAAMAGVFQMKIKKGGSKIYPIRFCEVIKIETIKAGA